MDAYEEARLAWWVSLRPGWQANGRRLRAMMPPEQWNDLDEDAKIKLAEHWCSWLCDAWLLPDVSFHVADIAEEDECGEFSADDWSVTIARRLLADGAAVVGVIAHELRHARQEDFLRQGRHPLGVAGIDALTAADADYDTDWFLNQYENELEWDADEAGDHVRVGYCDG